MGCSLLSIVEIIYFFFYGVFKNIFRKNKPQQNLKALELERKLWRIPKIITVSPAERQHPESDINQILEGLNTITTNVNELNRKLARLDFRVARLEKKIFEN